MNPATAAVVGTVAGLFGGFVVAVATARLVRDRLLAVVDERLAEIARDPDQWWFWTPEWQEGERQADEDLAAGRTVRFATEDDFDAYLDQIPYRHPVSTS